MKKSEIKFGDFYAGIGGFRLGLEKVGWTCVTMNEIDPECIKTYNEAFGEQNKPIPIEDLEATHLPDFDVFCAGFPCQPFSIAGKRNGLEDSRGKGIKEIVRICSAKNPKIILLENVKNIIRMDKGKILYQMIKMFSELGYNCSYGILDSKDFGIPQSRPRLFFVGVRQDLEVSIFDFNFPKKAEIPVKTVIEPGDFSIPISNRWEQYIDYYAGRISEKELTFDLPKTRKTIERADPNVDHDNCIYQMRSSGIRAISINRPFPTFAVSVSGGGAMIPVYSKERRHLSVLEIKRLMGFSHDFSFPVSRTNAIKQLSNAVCPSVVESLGEKLNNIIIS